MRHRMRTRNEYMCTKTSVGTYYVRCGYSGTLVHQRSTMVRCRVPVPVPVHRFGRRAKKVRTIGQRGGRWRTPKLVTDYRASWSRRVASHRIAKPRKQTLRCRVVASCLVPVQQVFTFRSEKCAARSSRSRKPSCGRHPVPFLLGRKMENFSAGRWSTRLAAADDRS